MFTKLPHLQKSDSLEDGQSGELKHFSQYTMISKENWFSLQFTLILMVHLHADIA